MARKNARPKARKAALVKKLRIAEAARPKRRSPTAPTRAISALEMEAALLRSGILR